MKSSLWNNLLNRDILDLIIGDKNCKKDILDNSVKMPYMRGIDIEKFSNKLSIPFDWQGISRWEMMKNVLIKVIEENKINLFFKELINKKRFQYIANMDNPMGFYYTPQSLYYDIIHQFFASVNNILSFDECYIEYNLDTYIFSIISFDEEIKIVTSSIEKIDGSYINKIIDEIEKAIKEKDYNSATTKSRTLIEETLIYGLQHKNVEISSKGDINKLFNQFKEAYKIKVGKDLDVRLNTIVSSLIKIITAVAELRNANSDSHGVGDNNRFELKEREIRLLSNSSSTLANYLLGIIEDD